MVIFCLRLKAHTKHMYPYGILIKTISLAWKELFLSNKMRKWKKKIENDWFKLEQLSEWVMALCFQALMPKTNWLGVIDILLITQAKLSFLKNKTKKLKGINVWEIRLCSYLELGWYLRGKWPIKVLNTWYLGWKLESCLWIPIEPYRRKFPKLRKKNQNKFSYLFNLKNDEIRV